MKSAQNEHPTTSDECIHKNWKPWHCWWTSYTEGLPLSVKSYDINEILTPAAPIHRKLRKLIIRHCKADSYTTWVIQDWKEIMIKGVCMTDCQGTIVLGHCKRHYKTGRYFCTGSEGKKSKEFRCILQVFRKSGLLEHFTTDNLPPLPESLSGKIFASVEIDQELKLVRASKRQRRPVAHFFSVHRQKDHPM